MKTYSTQFYLTEKLSVTQFIDVVAHIHSLTFKHTDTLQYKTQIDPTTILYYYKQYHTIVLQIKNHHYLEYIYNEENQGLCIHESGEVCNYTFIDELIKHQWIQNDGYLPISQNPICIHQDNIHQVIDFLDYHHAQLPIVYINYQQIISPHQIALRLRGIAHVLYEDNANISRQMKMESTMVPQHGKVAIYFLNKDFKTYRLLKNESQNKFTQRIIHNIEIFLKQRQYGFPFDFHSLQKKYIEDLKYEASHLEQNTILQLDQQMQTLEKEKEKLMKNLKKLENNLLLLQNQNDYLRSEISIQNEYSLLNMGQINEFYSGEQKDIILELLEDELKRKNYQDEETAMIKDLLYFNPKEGVRDEYLNQIFKILVSGHDLDKLKNYGITFKHHGNHLVAVFFKNSRYQSTISCTPSDMNSCRQIFRQFRNTFF